MSCASCVVLGPVGRVPVVEARCGSRRGTAGARRRSRPRMPAASCPAFSAAIMIGAPWASSAQTKCTSWPMHALEPHPDVGLDVLHHVPDVEGRVGVGQGGGDEQLAGHGAIGCARRAGNPDSRDGRCKAPVAVNLRRLGTCRAARLFAPRSLVSRPPFRQPHGHYRIRLLDVAQDRDRPQHRRATSSRPSRLKNLKIDGGDVAFDVELGYPAKSQIPALRKALIAAARTRARRGATSASTSPPRWSSTRCSAACSCCPR